MRYSSSLKPFIKNILIGVFLFTVEAKAVQIITSIVPLHSLASKLLKDIAQPHLLLDGTESAHTYSLKPVDLKKIYEADLIIWVGPSYETFLKKAITSSKKATLSVLEAPNLNLLPLRSTCHHDHEDTHKHECMMDPHVWLDPTRVKDILRFMHQRFLLIFPQEQKKLAYNLDQALKTLDALHHHLQAILQPVKNQPFMVYHDGYQYLEQAYDLRNLGPLTVYPEAPLSLQDKQRVIHYTQSYPSLCVFAESQFSPKILKDLQATLHFKSGTLDPLGIDLEGIFAYDTMITLLATNLRSCLAP